MVYIYLPVAYYHLNLDVTKENLLTAGFPLSQRSLLLSTEIRFNISTVKPVIKTT